MRARRGAKMTLRGLLRQGHGAEVSPFSFRPRGRRPKTPGFGATPSAAIAKPADSAAKRGFWIGPPGPERPARRRERVPHGMAASLNWGFVDPPSGHRARVVDRTRQAIAQAPPAPIQNPHHAEVSRFRGVLTIRDLGGHRGRPRAQPRRAPTPRRRRPRYLQGFSAGAIRGLRILPSTPARWRRSRPR